MLSFGKQSVHHVVCASFRPGNTILYSALHTKQFPKSKSACSNIYTSAFNTKEKFYSKHEEKLRKWHFLVETLVPPVTNHRSSSYNHGNQLQVLSSQLASGSNEIKQLPCYQYMISLQSLYSSSIVREKSQGFSRGDQSLLITVACLPPVTVKSKQVPYTGWCILPFP